jgi:hypothetical protein
MGLGNSSGRFTYVNIKEGSLIIKKGGVIETFTFLEGYLHGLDIRDEEYQGDQYKKLCLTINDGSEDFQLQMRLDSGYGRAFCNMVEEIDLSQPFKVTPTYKEEDGKKRSGMFINQNGKALKWKYTKNHPGNLPEMKKVMFKGKEVWDNTDQQAFYIDLLLNKIKPNLKNSVVDGPAHQFGDKPVDAASVTEPFDDLPF